MESNNHLMAAQAKLQVETARQELRACNETTAQYGLSLSEPDIQELVSCRVKSLRDSGRVEFGSGILPKLIQAFCDSPYVSQENYKDLLVELQDAFYYFKNESMDRFSDDELIEFMAKVFNGRAQGSVEYLTETSLEDLCRYAREGWDPYDADKAGDQF